MALRAKLTAAISGVLSKLQTHGQTSEEPFNFFAALDLLSGVGNGQADLIYSRRHTIAGGANLDLDLSGALENDLGDPVVFAKVKGFMAIHRAGASPLVIGNAAATPFVGWFGGAVHTEELPVGGFVARGRSDLAAWAVGAGASDLLRLANGGGGPVDVDIVIVGTSA